MIKLSIIIPYYKKYEEVKKLLDTLLKQKTEEVEIIVVDDGCNETRLDQFRDITVIHLEENSGGASIPRNKGLDIAKGDYICFIDADDLVKDNYISTILNKIKTSEFDYCYFSWECSTHKVIIKDEPPKWNCCVWNCIYKRDLIGGTRFRKDLKMAEDFYFNKEVRKGKRENITEVLYYYNQDSKDSLTKQGKTYNEKYKGEENGDSL